MVKKKRPTDTNQLAKSVVDIATSEDIADKKKNTKMADLGRKGGMKGGKARANKLTSAQRKAIAKKAAETRWKNKK